MDIHVMLAGEERVDLNHPEELELFRAEEDGDFYAYRGVARHSIILRPGMFLVVFPGDAHRIKVWVNGPETVSKAVFKIRLDG